MRKQSLQALYKRYQHGTYVLNKPKVERIKASPLVTRQYYVPSIIHADYNNAKKVNEVNQECSEVNRWCFLHTILDNSALPETLCTSLTNVIKLLHRCAVNVSLSFRSVRELSSQSFDLRQEIKSLAALLELYNACYNEQSSKHELRVHMPNRMVLANHKFISTLNCCIRYHNSFADYKHNRLKNIGSSNHNNSNNDKQHAKHILQLSAWYKKQMECNLITAEDVPHVLNVIKVNSHRNNLDCNDSNRNDVTRSNTKAVLQNNITGSPNEERSIETNEQISSKTSVEQATITSSFSTNTVTTCAQSSSYVLAFILASLEQDMEYDIIEPLCSLLLTEDKLFLLQYCCCIECEEKCETKSELSNSSESVKNSYYSGKNTNKEWQTQIVLLTPTAKKLCISLVSELTDNPAYLAYIPAIKLIPVINTLHHNNILTKTFLEHALLRVWQCNCNTMACIDVEDYIQCILLTLHVEELYLPHHTIASLLRRSEMHFESCAYQSQITREFVVNTQPRSAHGLERTICRLITEYVQEKLNSSEISGVKRVDNDVIDKYIRCAPCTSNASLDYTFIELLQVMPTTLQSYSVQLLLYTLGRCLREHENISIDFDNMVHELHLQELGVQAITTAMEMIKYIHFVLRQGGRQTASVLLNGLHTKQEIAAVMKCTHSAGSKMALHALRQLMLLQPSLECYVAITIKVDNQLVSKTNSNSGYNMLHKKRNRSNSKYRNHTIITFHVQRDRVELGNEMWLNEQFMSNNALCPFYHLPEREQRIFYHTVLSTVVHGSFCDFAAFANYMTPNEQTMPQIALPSLLAAVPLCAIDKIVRALPSKTSDAFSYWAMCELYARHVYEAMKVLYAATVHHIMPEMAVLVHLLEVCEELQLNYLHLTKKSMWDNLVDAEIGNDNLCKVRMTKQSVARKAMKLGASNRMRTTKATNETNDTNKQDYSIIFDNAVHFVEEHFSDVSLVVFRAYVERFYTRHGKSTQQSEGNTIKSVNNTINTKSTNYSNSDNMKERKQQLQTSKHSIMPSDVSNFIISFVLHHLIPNCTSHQVNKSSTRMTATNNINYNNQGMYKFINYNVNRSIIANNDSKTNMYLESIPLQWEIINALVQNMTATEDNYDDAKDSNIAEVDVIVRSPITLEVDWWSSSQSTYKASFIKHLYRHGATSLWPLAWQEIQHITEREQTTSISHVCNLYSLQSTVQSSDVTYKCNIPNKYVQHNELMQVHRALRLMICGCANSSECLERIRSCEHLLMPHEQQETRKRWIVNQLFASNELRAIHTLSLAANVFIRRGDYRITLELLPPHLNETLPPQLRLAQLTAMQQTEEFAELATLLLSDTVAECQALQDECCTHNKQYQKRHIRLATRKRKSKLCRLCKVCRCEDALHKTQGCKNSHKSNKNNDVNSDKNDNIMTTQQLLELQGMLYKRPLRKFVRSTFNDSINYEGVN